MLPYSNIQLPCANFYQPKKPSMSFRLTILLEIDSILPSLGYAEFIHPGLNLKIKRLLDQQGKGNAIESGTGESQTLDREMSIGLSTEQVNTDTVQDSVGSDSARPSSTTNPKDFESLPNQNSNEISARTLAVQFQSLRAVISKLVHLRDLDPLFMVTPFLNVIKWCVTPSSITLKALSSIMNFINLKVLNPHHPDIKAAVIEVVDALVRCKFEPLDLVNDEVVLLTLVKTMNSLVNSELIKFINDGGLNRIFEVNIGILTQPRMSELVRTTATWGVLDLIRAVMDRVEWWFVVVSQRQVEANYRSGALADSEHATFIGASTLLEILHIIGKFLDPNELRQTNVHKVMGLKMLDEIVSRKKLLSRLMNDLLSNPSIGSVAQSNGQLHRDASPKRTKEHDETILQTSIPNNKTLLQFQDDIIEVLRYSVSKQLLHLLISPTSHKILDSLIRSCILLFAFSEDTGKDGDDFLIAHKEFLIRWICEKLTAGLQPWDLDIYVEEILQAGGLSNEPLAAQSNSVIDLNQRDSQSRGRDSNYGKRVEPLDPGTRYMYLHLFYHILTPPTLSLLYTRNDCQEWESSNIVGEVILNTMIELTLGDKKGIVDDECLSLAAQILVKVLKEWNEKVVQGSISTSDNESWTSKLQKKDKILNGCKVFRDDIKAGIVYFQELGLLPDPITDDSMAAFLYHSELDKSRVGDYLAKPKHLPVLQCFTKYFDFSGLRIDEALRVYLDKFRLPGESQQIERILDTFSNQYFEYHKEQPNHEIQNLDACGILAFSIIMLNTDQHNPQKKMSLSDYQRNIRGLNNGTDFPQELVSDIYHTIRENEIVLAEEHGDAYMHQFAAIAKRINYKHKVSNNVDSLIIGNNWKSIVGGLIYCFENTEDMNVLQFITTGLRYCVSLAAAYGIDPMMDFIILGIARATGLYKTDRIPTEIDLLAKKERKKMDRWLVKLGQNQRAQVANVLLFSIVDEFGDYMKTGWRFIVTILGNLYLHQCLPLELMTAEHFVCKLITIPRILSLKPLDKPKKEVGLFSSFAQFLLSSESEETTDPMTIQWEAQAINSLNLCDFRNLLEETKFLKTETCTVLLQTLVELSFSDDSFTTAAVFYMEVMFWIFMRNRDRVKVLWKSIHSFWDLVMRPVTPTILVERCTTNILRLLLRMSNPDSQEDAFQVLEKVTSLPTETLLIFGEHLVTGLLQIAKTDFSLLSKPSRCQILFRILSVTATQPFASSVCYELMCFLFNANSEILTSEFFGDLVDLLVSFSSGVYGTSAPRSSLSTLSAPQEKTPPVTQSQLALERALQTMEKLYQLHMSIPSIVNGEEITMERKWFEYWLPILSGQSQQCVHPSIEIRHQALIHLQRLLLSSDLSQILNSKPENRIDVFDIVIFPTLEILSTTKELDPIGLGETNLRVSSLATKTFLQYAHDLPEKALPRIWNDLLTFLLRMAGIIATTAGANALKILDHVREGILESIKNVVLVLSADGVLKKDEELWITTWNKLDPVFSNLKQEILDSTTSNPSPAPEATEKPPAETPIPVNNENNTPQE